MKVFSVAGYHHTGKTTAVVNLIKELKKRSHRVVSIKDIHAENFSMEKKGSNTWKHWEASGDCVFARGLHETYLIWHRHLPLKEMLLHLAADYVVVEGMKTAPLPKIICASDENELKELLDDTVFAISGKFADENTEYKHLPVKSAINNIEELTDLVEQHVFEVLPLSEPECKNKCGGSCYGMVGQILTQKRSRQDCPYRIHTIASIIEL